VHAHPTYTFLSWCSPAFGIGGAMSNTMSHPSKADKIKHAYVDFVHLILLKTLFTFLNF